MNSMMIDFARAPIGYADIRRAYQTMRFATALAIGATMIIALTAGLWWAGTVLAGACFLAADAWRRRNVGTSIEPSVFIDMTAITAGVLISGTAHAAHSHSTQAAGTVAVMTAAILMLPMARSLVVIAYAAICNGIIVLVGPSLAFADEGVAGETHVVEQLITGIFLAATVVILYGAARTLIEGAARTEHALEQERRANELKNEFVSMVSHELRTPLTSIAGFIDTLQAAWTDLPPGEVEEFLDIVSDEAGHLSRLVEDILVIPRLEAGRLPLQITEFDPREDVFSCIDSIFSNGHRNREIDVSMPGVIRVRADRSRVEQILRNLLENARKYGGEEILVDASIIEGFVRFVVADNGPGVPETDRHRIFEPFEQVGKGDAREATGIGLGLPIAAHLTAAMGGRMWYEQAFPRGARFCFTLPLAAELAERFVQVAPDAGETTP